MIDIVVMVQSHGSGYRLGGHWDTSVAASRIAFGRYAQNTIYKAQKILKNL